MSSSRKKAILRRFSGDVVHGYLATGGFVREGGVDLLSLEGRNLTVPLSEVKTICFVRDFNLTDLFDPERMERRHFQTRPRGGGVWLRVVFRDTNDQLEGLMPADVTLLDSLLLEQGLLMTPPDARSNTQKIYVPRLAIASLEMLAVITTNGKRRSGDAPAQTSGRAVPPRSSQDSLFHDATDFAETSGKRDHAQQAKR